MTRAMPAADAAGTEGARRRAAAAAAVAPRTKAVFGSAPRANPRRFFYSAGQISPRDRARCIPCTRVARRAEEEIAVPAMNVPAAFRSPPRMPAHVSGDACACGSALFKTYVIMRVLGRAGRHRHVKTPVLWCPPCRNLGSSIPVKGQTEVRDGRFKWACEHCGGAMYRLLITRGGTAGQAIPLSYCAECVSVSFRAPVGQGDTRTCDMCHTVVPARNRWCAGCQCIADQWRKRRGVIPPSDDWRFEEVIRRVKEEAHRLGWGRCEGRRVCVSCRAEYAPASPRQRRCGACADDYVRERRERARLARRRSRELERAAGGRGAAGADRVAEETAAAAAAAVVTRGGLAKEGGAGEGAGAPPEEVVAAA